MTPEQLRTLATETDAKADAIEATNPGKAALWRNMAYGYRLAADGKERRAKR